MKSRGRFPKLFDFGLSSRESRLAGYLGTIHLNEKNIREELRNNYHVKTNPEFKGYLQDISHLITLLKTKKYTHAVESYQKLYNACGGDIMRILIETCSHSTLDIFAKFLRQTYSQKKQLHVLDATEKERFASKGYHIPLTSTDSSVDA